MPVLTVDDSAAAWKERAELAAAALDVERTRRREAETLVLELRRALEGYVHAPARSAAAKLLKRTAHLVGRRD